MDRRCGNTNNLGAIFGVLSAIGVPVPQPGTIGFTIAQTVNRVQTALACAPPLPGRNSMKRSPQTCLRSRCCDRSSVASYIPPNQCLQIV